VIEVCHRTQRCTLCSKALLSCILHLTILLFASIIFLPADTIHHTSALTGEDPMQMLNGAWALVTSDGHNMTNVTHMENGTKPMMRQWGSDDDLIGSLVDTFVDAVTDVLAYVFYAPDMNITINGNVTVELADILLSNGIVHVIDSIMIPPEKNETETMGNSTMMDDEETAVAAAEAKDIDGGMV